MKTVMCHSVCVYTCQEQVSVRIPQYNQHTIRKHTTAWKVNTTFGLLGFVPLFRNVFNVCHKHLCFHLPYERNPILQSTM